MSKELEKECAVRKILEQHFKMNLIKMRMDIGKRSDGSTVFREFDIVSVRQNNKFNGNIVGEVKSDKYGSENAFLTTRFPRVYLACSYLEKIKAKRKLLILTDRKFYERFIQYADGRLDNFIEILHINPKESSQQIFCSIKNQEKRRQGMRKRNWLVEDNLVALYIALYRYKDLRYTLQEIIKIIIHKGFPMRIQQYIAINTKGAKGLKGGLKSPLLRELYDIFTGFNQELYAKLVNLILDVKLKINQKE